MIVGLLAGAVIGYLLGARVWRRRHNDPSEGDSLSMVIEDISKK